MSKSAEAATDSDNKRKSSQRRGLVKGPDFRYFQRRSFTAAEVAQHKEEGDLWVSYLGHVYDLTPLAEEYKGNILLKPIVEAAGTDISHWFDAKTKDIRKHVDPLTNTLRYRTPWGRFIHIPPQLPRSDWATDYGKPWWQGTQYMVGRLISKTRHIRLVNLLTAQEHILEVGTLETMWEIVHRFLAYNAHAASYTWKYDGRILNMDRTLEENGIYNEEDDFELLKMDDPLYLPAITLHFNDDLTEL
ncbi:cytochrome b5 domain-containing protein 1-like [Erinaceus europaeus]|uniref:Cytochrome b5 domain-containing protein 1 n=1 Tax=Erinaceus europaeus TaxID=9365 RepID=A0ABM3WF05_ERIEU|nr:cytochrome b5 domain-containing protein 1-like [Erinaceus europaeus]